MPGAAGPSSSIWGRFAASTRAGLEQLGPDTGFDSIGDWPQAAALGAYLDRLDQEDALPKMILYNNNPVDNYPLATMIGNFQDGSVPGKMQFGSGWWFLDTKEGIEWQINALSNVGLLSRFVGMLTDSRSFMSYPRHEYFRRVLCNLLGSDIESGEIPDDDELVGPLIENICYGNARDISGPGHSRGVPAMSSDLFDLTGESRRGHRRDGRPGRRRWRMPWREPGRASRLSGAAAERGGEGRAPHRSGGRGGHCSRPPTRSTPTRWPAPATPSRRSGGRSSVLVNAAGGNRPDATLPPGADFTKLPLAAWREVFDLNLVGGVLLPCQVFGEAMLAAGRGSVINIASLSGMTPLSRVVAYSAAKAAVLNLTQFLAREWAPRGVRVNALSPGFFPAEQNRALLMNPDGSYTARGEQIIGHTPMARFGKPEELAGAVVWLAAPRASSFVTGQNIVVDGGFSAVTI